MKCNNFQNWQPIFKKTIAAVESMTAMVAAFQEIEERQEKPPPKTLA